MRVYYQGSPGSFSYQVAESLFGDSAALVGTREFREIFTQVAENEGDCGVVPVENSLAGSVYENFDHLLSFPVTITAEVYLQVEHHLLVLPEAAQSGDVLCKIRKVYSHPKALEQCGRFLATLPSAESVVAKDTAGAAKFVKEAGNSSFAAIASAQAATLYGLAVAASNIEDHANNITRFVVISGKPSGPFHGPQKCSIAFTLPHRPGSLSEVLAVVARAKLNLTKIESRPVVGSTFEYHFFVDFELAEDSAENSLTLIKGVTEQLKLLGVYRAGAKPSA